MLWGRGLQTLALTRSSVVIRFTVSFRVPRLRWEPRRLCGVVRMEGMSWRRVSLAPCWAPGSPCPKHQVNRLPSLPSATCHVHLLLIQGRTPSSSFAGFLRHLHFSGQVSLFIFPCQRPLRASKSRLNNRSMFPCWRVPGQAGPGAKWLSPA